jgi:hypothetical protein
MKPDSAASGVRTMAGIGDEIGAHFLDRRSGVWSWNVISILVGAAEQGRHRYRLCVMINSIQRTGT